MKMAVFVRVIAYRILQLLHFAEFHRILAKRKQRTKETMPFIWVCGSVCTLASQEPRGQTTSIFWCILPRLSSGGVAICYYYQKKLHSL